jgi:dTDP-4-amino-4,6-dideoxygalactose transaminase
MAGSVAFATSTEAAPPSVPRPTLSHAARSVPYVALGQQFAAESAALLARLQRTLESGQWVAGPEVAELETKLAERLGARECVAVGSGTDALILSLRALGIGPGDEVITAPNSFIATASAIVHVGATPVFADVLPDQNIDPARVAAAVTPRTRAILPVHLSGRTARMPELLDIASRHDLRVIEDAAQAIDARLSGQAAGTFGDLGCFSCHPLKNLNAAGDAGFILANDEAQAVRLRRMRSNGLIDRETALEWGVVSRLDSVQAAVLLERLPRLDSVTEARRRNAHAYRQLLADVPQVFMPPCRAREHNVFHTFVIQVDRRDELQAFLQTRGIGTAIHYKIPIHLQPAARTLGYGPGSFPVAEQQAQRILSLPVHQFLSPQDVEHVALNIREFFA